MSILLTISVFGQQDNNSNNESHFDQELSIQMENNNRLISIMTIEDKIKVNKIIDSFEDMNEKIYSTFFSDTNSFTLQVKVGENTSDITLYEFNDSKNYSKTLFSLIKKNMSNIELTYKEIRNLRSLGKIQEKITAKVLIELYMKGSGDKKAYSRIILDNNMKIIGMILKLEIESSL